MARPLISVAFAAAVLAGAPAHGVDVPTRAELAAEVAQLQVQIDTIKADKRQPARDQKQQQPVLDAVE